MHICSHVQYAFAQAPGLPVYFDKGTPVKQANKLYPVISVPTVANVIQPSGGRRGYNTSLIITWYFVGLL